jgi:hypothetical protein
VAKEQKERIVLSLQNAMQNTLQNAKNSMQPSQINHIIQQDKIWHTPCYNYR